MGQQLPDYIPVLLQFTIAVVLAVGIIGTSQLLGQRAPANKLKDSAYECGVPAEGSPSARFSIKFYLTAMLFILFDIEVVFLFPWVLVYRDFLAANVAIFLPVMFFIFVLVVGLFYEIRKGALKWEK